MRMEVNNNSSRRQPINHTLSFLDGENMHNMLHSFSILNLKKTCQRHLPCSRATTHTAIYRLISEASTVIQERIREEVIGVVQKGFQKYGRRHVSLSRDGDVQILGQDEDMRSSGHDIQLSADEGVVNELCENLFMRTPLTKVINDARVEFIDRTSNEVVAVGSCSSCAQEMARTDLMVFSINAIPNGHNLKPAEFHPRHDLYGGMLLHPKGVVEDASANVCYKCAQALKMDKVPMLALANKLWIGKTPDKLKFLTLPEQILVTKYIPVAYIVELYPKKSGAHHWDQRQMHSGVKGNISPYRLDQSQIMSMIDGTLMPPVSKVLAATIGVTFVGPKNLLEKTMPKFFRVRRKWVRNALEWLKANNPLYNIIISDSRLAALPEDGVPYELMATVKHATDVDMLYTEQDRYVPLEDIEEVDDTQGWDFFARNILESINIHVDVDKVSEGEHEDPESPTEAGVLPLAHLGVVDVDGVEVTDLELLAHALANCCKGRQEEDYMIRRGSADVNHLLGSFPTLFPFGQGGFEIECEVNVPYETHVRWALRYEDKRFQQDLHFPFQVFGVCQKRQNVLSSISAEDLTKASREETRGVPFSNPGVQMFRGLLSTVKTKVQGSDESRKSIRGKIWGMNLLHNPPSLWVTINPLDTQDPIAQVFAGADIDLDRFCETAGPDCINRAINIASNPYASAKYFHFIIATILEVLIGVTKHRNGMITGKEGIFGVVKSYIGMVEVQGCGSLHLHLLLWLDGDDWVDSSGGWGPKRLCGFLNNWNPPLLMSIRANHNMKLFMNGSDTSMLTWYITNYASKKQQRSSNVSALLAKWVAFHKVEEKGHVDITNISKRLIQHCVNTLTCEREFSGPEVISYLMGWGD
ncbi:hypothetical protein BYT27DRAFT_7257469 [Phlegmacium glaucopus]|nr:hypothetical protein BYT27DRAFT_7257469 [Phlegmacium glaucopus]